MGEVKTETFRVDLQALRGTLEAMIDAAPPPVERAKLPGEPRCYVVICRGGCGEVELTTAQYLAQMRAADHGWSCPQCGEDAWFSDRVFEAWCAWAEKNDPKALREGNE